MKRCFIACMVVSLLLGVSACRKHTVIPDSVLAEIFHDAFVANAYIGVESIDLDSLQIYEPIFERYGYTAKDVAYTVGNFSRRKSARLGTVVEQAISRLEKESKMYAKKVVVITDNLVPYPLTDFSIPESYVDYVVQVDAIGNPKGIVSGTTRITRDPVGLVMASYAAKVIEHSGLLQDGFSFQTGAGGASLAAAKFLKDIMLEKNIKGSFGLGGITGYMVDMLKAGCFQRLLDVQCFDLDAVESIRTDPRHREVSAMQYASPASRSASTMEVLPELVTPLR